MKMRRVYSEDGSIKVIHLDGGDAGGAVPAPSGYAAPKAGTGNGDDPVSGPSPLSPMLPFLSGARLFGFPLAPASPAADSFELEPTSFLRLAGWTLVTVLGFGAVAAGMGYSSSTAADYIRLMRERNNTSTTEIVAMFGIMVPNMFTTFGFWVLAKRSREGLGSFCRDFGVCKSPVSMGNWMVRIIKKINCSS